MSQGSHYRWNVDPTWENFCGLVREAAEVRDARSPVHKHHHLRAALYFSIGSIEAFLNQTMRQKMHAEGAAEDAILTFLKKSRWARKATHWPSELVGAPVKLPEDLLNTLVDFNDLRGEITHAKAKDHSIYLELDRLMMNPDMLRLATAEYFVRLLAALGRPYPFFLHGWIFIGMGGDPHSPIVDLHNQQFMMALRHMGFNVPHVLVDEMDAWERTCMSSWESFLEGEKALATALCQPRDPRFSHMPRLCRRWWDDAHVENCGEAREYPLPRFMIAPNSE